MQISHTGVEFVVESPQGMRMACMCMCTVAHVGASTVAASVY